ncbi:MAG: acyl-CoA dehydrogenase family protein [Pseudohongiellaceae bacterium]|nr:acyl-CoA dehydrogenase family protein [Pseudohongiellaceae bacterium]
MTMVLNEDQLMLKESAQSFCQSVVPVSAFRQLRDEKNPDGFSRDVWKQMVELGWAGMSIPEEFGGFGFGYGGLEVVLEETGRTLAASPLFSTAVLGATAVNLGGNQAQKETILPAVAQGELLLALAHEETPFHQPTRVETTATKDGDQYVLSGHKTFVLDGHVADKIIVVARTSGSTDDSDGISLFIIDKDSAGLSIKALSSVDSRNVSKIRLDKVSVGEEAVLGEIDKGYEILEKVLDVGRICLAAEMLGNAQQVFDCIIDYLKQREQFGVLIGSFQGLQHRAATMYSELELCRSVVRRAFAELDGEQKEVPRLASIAKAKLSEALGNISNEGVQMHGGIGMTDEFDIGFYMKRARVVQQYLGDDRFHRNRYAQLKGF